MASHTNLIVFRPEREGLEGLLLDQALKLHNAKTFEERQQLRKARIKGNRAPHGGGAGPHMEGEQGPTWRGSRAPLGGGAGPPLEEEQGPP